MTPTDPFDLLRHLAATMPGPDRPAEVLAWLESVAGSAGDSTSARLTADKLARDVRRQAQDQIDRLIARFESVANITLAQLPGRATKGQADGVYPVPAPWVPGTTQFVACPSATPYHATYVERLPGDHRLRSAPADCFAATPAGPVALFARSPAPCPAWVTLAQLRANKAAAERLAEDHRAEQAARRDRERAEEQRRAEAAKPPQQRYEERIAALERQVAGAST